MDKLTRFMNGIWDGEIIPTLTDYIRIPNKSPMFDPDWEKHGHMDKVVALFETWARAKLAKLPGATLEVVRVAGRTPLIFIEVPGKTAGTVLLYGHLDKQPEMKGWAEGMGPWTPVLKDNKLYGRGGADDGYAMFASIAALLALAEQKIDHARCVITIEAGEESGSPDLPFYIEHLAERIGTPDLIVCLDSGCGNYDQLWLTTSLRGIAAGKLSVRVLTEGVHSGDASGIVPSSFRILRALLSRIEDETTGAMKLSEFFAPVPDERVEQARAASRILGNDVYTKLPFAGTTKPMAMTPVEMILNRTWKPQLAVIGMEGYPLPEHAGNVLLPYSVAKLSLRTPPTCDAEAAVAALKNVLEDDPPYGAEVKFEAEAGQTGWNAPSLAPWLEASLRKASESHFGKPVAYMGEGGSIPFMAMLGKKFPKTQFVVTGVLGPHSNAHGPNEFLHIPTAKKVSACIAEVLTDHAAAHR
ncbi:MAG: M20 family metallopeptidase [Alphaproteobacteria bacterium]|nr:M20 family metallopeptidase [Alphaproteobacteria bacterium]MDE1986068.1 M20 family metallopeptidase [Alphaproteobacteria bacterium]MDE2264398.1 M20 family metallopeptidase [Alphaproteobacteria bacterium]MDE2499366.1 M20 family metallopeptidase [Alphaproteobacteria bacterium]